MSEQRKVPKLRFPEFTDDWEQREFDDFFEYIPHNSLSRDNLNYDEGEVKNIHYGDVLIKFGEALNPTIEKIPFVNKDIKFDDKSCFLQDGDIVIADAAEDLTVGKCTEISNGCNQKLVAGLHTIPCRPKNKIEEGFLGFYLNSKAYHNQLLPLIQGTKVSSISKSSLKETWVTFPFSSNEQKKIGSFFLTLNNLITLHQRKCEVLKKLKKGLLQKMFPKDGTNIPEIRFPEFSDAWEQRKFGDTIQERREKSTKENEDTLLSCAINGIFLNSDLFSHFRGSSNIGYLKIRKNDLILSAQNLHLGNCNVNLTYDHGIVSPAYKVYELVNCYPYFMQAWVKKDCTKQFFLKAATEGASVCRKNIVWEDLYKQNILIPSYEEQVLIGDYFYKIDNLITLHQRKLEVLKKLKKGLLQQMFV